MSRADDFLLTAEELRLRRRKRRRLFIIGLGLVLLLVVGFFGARPTRHAIKSWQSRRHAHKSFAFLAQEKWTEAREEAVAAYQLRPNEPEALRAVARFLSRTRQPQALEFWDQLAKNQALTRDDLHDEATSALVAGEVGRAATAIEQLIANKSETKPVDWLLAAQLALQSGAPNDAATALQHIFTSPATTAREQLQAAVLELRAFGSASEEDRKHQSDGWQRISQLATGQDEIALDSLVLLAQRILASAPSPPNEQPSTASIIRALEIHPLAKAPQKLLAIDLRMHERPADKEALITRAIADWRDANASSLAALATWLNGHGEYQRELDTIPVERALQTRELFLQHVDALGALGRWDEIRHLLQSEQFPLEPLVQRMYLARCYAQLGQKVASENNWKRALEAAAGDAGKLMTLAEYAEKNGANEVADSAFAQATAAAPNARAAWQGRLRVAQASRDTRKIHAALAEMLKLWPNDTAIRNDEAYLRLLLLPNENQPGGTTSVSSQTSAQAGDDTAVVPPILPNESPSIIDHPASAVDGLRRGEQPSTSAELNSIEHLAETLVRREPASLPHRTLLALAQLRENRPYTALDAYRDIQVPANAASPAALAVHAAVLNATGDAEKAKNEAHQINLDQLLPEERDLIQDL